MTRLSYHEMKMNTIMNLETSGAKPTKAKRTRTAYVNVRVLCSVGPFRLVLERKNNLPSTRAAKQTNINETNEQK
jgi:hypothetical protein